MKRQTQNILYHLLPVVFWLLAIGGSFVGYLAISNFQFPISNVLHFFAPAVLAWVATWIIGRLKRHEEAVTPSFHVAVLLSIAAYWLPSVLVLVLPIWVYLFYLNAFSLRVVTATLIGFVLVAIWTLVLFKLSTLTYHLSPLTYNLYAWLPTGAFVVAYIASTIVRRTLRVR